MVFPTPLPPARRTQLPPGMPPMRAVSTIPMPNLLTPPFSPLRGNPPTFCSGLPSIPFFCSAGCASFPFRLILTMVFPRHILYSVVLCPFVSILTAFCSIADLGRCQGLDALPAEEPPQEPRSLLSRGRCQGLRLRWRLLLAPGFHLGLDRRVLRIVPHDVHEHVELAGE